jgi:hypothetical protein
VKKSDEERENKINGGVFVCLDKRIGRSDEVGPLWDSPARNSAALSLTSHCTEQHFDYV